LMIGDSSGLEVIRFKVEETLNDLMHVDTKIGKNDPRVRAIQADIQKLYNEEKRISCISDEELKKFVEKYFMLDSIIDEHSSNEMQN
jgi:hypothetical protein